MNISTHSSEELSLILTGLRAIYVENSEERRQIMMQKIEDKLAERGLRVDEHT